jgi:rhamnogalacturonyl hydrolase YesR
MHHSHFIYPTLMHGPTVAIPTGKGVLHCRATVAIVPQNACHPENLSAETQPVIWQFPQFNHTPQQSLWLRLIPAVDVRSYTMIRVFTGQTHQFLAQQSVGLPSVYEPLDIPLPDDASSIIAKEGLHLELYGDEPMHVFVQQGRSTETDISTDALSSGLVVQPAGQSRSELIQALEKRLCSAGSWQAWSWMGGCVLDGLWALSQVGSIQSGQHFTDAIDRFFDAYMTDYDLVCFTPKSVMVVNEIGGVEGGLPWATLMRVRPEHPVTELFANFIPRFMAEMNQKQHYSCEGNYTFNYPMMVTALAKNREDWINQVWENLRNWQDALRQHDGLYLRNNAGKLTYRNWARGCCWYSLGLVRTLEAAAEKGVTLPDDLLEEVNDVLSWLLAQQRADGLWSNFIDEQAMMPDTSGSAGIAAAMTIAANAGMLEETLAHSCLQAANYTLDTVLHYVTADGHLTGVAPNNKAESGTTLQRQTYRVTMQFGTGLLASLLAAQRQAGSGISAVDDLD